MNDPNDFRTRVKNARIVQVLVAYLAISWGILFQVADILQQSLKLPSWIQPVALLLLVIGLVIIAATAWVQCHPATAERAARDPRLKRARVYERSGEAGKAREAYLYFVQSWANADTELQPIVERAKQDIVRLRGDYSA